VQIDFPNERKEQQKLRQQIVTVGNEDEKPMPCISVICVKSHKYLGEVVASVRETAGQVLYDPNQGMTIIFQLSRNNVWRVRQGDLVALKYNMSSWSSKTFRKAAH
jgi:hypothetical protein